MFLAASTGLHLFALCLFKPATPARSAPWRDTPLQWVDLAPPPLRLVPLARDTSGPEIRPRETMPDDLHAVVPPTATAVVEPASVAVPRTAPAAPDLSGAERAPSASMTAFLFTAPARRGPSTAEFLRQARDIARQSPSPATPQEQSDGPEDRAILPGLDRALRREGPGEHRYDDGMVKMVTPAGRVYCLKPPPEFARGGPTASLSVPTNCP